MRRFVRVLYVGVILACIVCAPTANVAASVNSFYFSDFSGDYYLSKDSDGRSKLRVIETLTAEFPDFDQNKGIERAIPSMYDGHSVSFHLESLTRNGQTEPVYSQTTKNSNVVIGTGTDEYVHGTQVYQFTYTLSDVTKDFGDHQEFYWDINGTEWSQYFGQVTARVHLTDDLVSASTGDTNCIEGAYGSKDRTCVVNKADPKELVFTSNGRINARETMTIVAGFKAGTFVSRPWSPLDLLIYAPLLVCGIGIVGTIYIWRRFGRNAPGRGTIVPEYLPPKNVPVLLAGELYGATSKAVTAQIIDLAVRHNIRITETETDGLFGKSSNYSIELLSLDGLGETELRTVDDLFVSREIGTVYTFQKTDTGTGIRLQASMSEIAKKAESDGFRHRHKKATYILVAGSIGIMAMIFVFFVVGAQTAGFVLFISFIVGIITVILMGIAAANLRPLTVTGRELYDYLKGLEMYIKLTEADRLKVLQSPTGAEKTPVDTTDNVQIVKIYERVLPYAVLFGLEKDWAKELAIRYDQNNSQPDWYSGSSAFNAAVFASSLSNFSSTATNFSSPASSSSSGLGGGGFSGGGGGGGGGGGR